MPVELRRQIHQDFFTANALNAKLMLAYTRALEIEQDVPAVEQDMLNAITTAFDAQRKLLEINLQRTETQTNVPEELTHDQVQALVQASSCSVQKLQSLIDRLLKLTECGGQEGANAVSSPASADDQSQPQHPGGNQHLDDHLRFRGEDLFQSSQSGTNAAAAASTQRFDGIGDVEFLTDPVSHERQQHLDGGGFGGVPCYPPHSQAIRNMLPTGSTARSSGSKPHYDMDAAHAGTLSNGFNTAAMHVDYNFSAGRFSATLPSTHEYGRQQIDPPFYNIQSSQPLNDNHNAGSNSQISSQQTSQPGDFTATAPQFYVRLPLLNLAEKTLIITKKNENDAYQQFTTHPQQPQFQPAEPADKRQYANRYTV